MANGTSQTGITYNHDIAALQARLTRFMSEIWKSGSSGVSEMNEFDRIRLMSYLESLEALIAWIQDQPNLDMPESAPREHTLQPVPQFTEVENESINDVLRILDQLVFELVNSQSSRIPCRLIDHDEKRCRAVIEKLKKYISDYIEPTTPLDLPESSPQSIMAGPGRTGV